MMKLSIIGAHSFESYSTDRWRLRQDAGSGAPTIEISASSFVIGRAKDCDLVLPESEALRSTTSRWHCHLQQARGVWTVADGGTEAHPDTGRTKPSISGTRVNGKRISASTALKAGDTLEVGPWRLQIEMTPTQNIPPTVDASDILGDVARGKGLTVEAADPKLKAQFGQLHELVQHLAQIPGIEESMTALLSYCTNKIQAAEVAAILLEQTDGGFEVRSAWQKNLGAMPDFRFSEALLKNLPREQSFLLESKLKDLSESQNIHDISSGMLLPLWGKGERLGVFYLDNRRTGQSFSEEDLYLGSALASLISLQLTLESRASALRIEENMARYFAPDVVQSIIEQSEQDRAVGLDVQERDVTVLFVDMEGFTTASQTKTPREISEMLNPYLETVADCIQQSGGHVNKFIGDAVMGIFGPHPGQADGDPEDFARQAVTAALKIPGAWAKTAAEQHLTPLRLRIGINSGRAVVGNIGYSARLEYSVLGDTVNLASRFEKLAPPNRAAVTEATKQLCGKDYSFDDLGEQPVKGVGKMRVYSPKP
jgi:adenylate cyclase